MGHEEILLDGLPCIASQIWTYLNTAVRSFLDDDGRNNRASGGYQPVIWLVWSASVPVVGSNIGGLAGYIAPGFNGELFPPGDDEALAACIKTMMSLDSVGYDSYKANAAASSIKYESGVVAEAMMTRLEKVVHDFCVSGA